MNTRKRIGSSNIKERIAAYWNGTDPTRDFLGMCIAGSIFVGAMTVIGANLWNNYQRQREVPIEATVWETYERMREIYGGSPPELRIELKNGGTHTLSLDQSAETEIYHRDQAERTARSGILEDELRDIPKFPASPVQAFVRGYSKAETLDVKLSDGRAYALPRVEDWAGRKVFRSSERERYLKENTIYLDSIRDMPTDGRTRDKIYVIRN